MTILRFHFQLINYPLMNIEAHGYIFQIVKNVTMPRKSESCEYSFVKMVP
jgi:hypothetical protein